MLAYVLDRRGNYMDLFARMIDDVAMLELLFRTSSFGFEGWCVN